MKKPNHLVGSNRFASGARSKHIVFIRSLTFTTWIVTVFLSLLFYMAVRMNLTGIGWLAGLLLGMLLLGWIMVVYYYHLTGTENHGSNKELTKET